MTLTSNKCCSNDDESNENADGATFTRENRFNECRKIGVTSKHDKLPCDITGACFDTNGYRYLVIADNANTSVKLLNVSDGLLMSVVLLEDGPWDLTYVEDEGQVATTIPSAGKIQFLSISQTGDLGKENEISAGAQCRGIVYSHGCFIVSYGNSRSKTGGKIRIMHANGVLLHTFSKDRFGNDLFQYPSHLTLSKDQNTIFVTDFAKGSVTSLHIDGTVNAVFKDDQIKDPRGLVVGADDTLCVCDFFSNCVYELSKDLKTCRLLLDKRDGLTSPRSLAFKQDDNTLFVTMFYKRFIAAFNVCT